MQPQINNPCTSKAGICGSCGALLPCKRQSLSPEEIPAGATYIRQKQLLQIVPFSAATLWRKVKSKEFPAPLKLSERVTAWRVEDVRAWLKNRAYR